MSPRRKQSDAVTAIFDPAGAFRLTVTAPSGNIYVIEPRVAFEIDGEDVDWFFNGWDRQHRQHLSQLEDYRPRKPQFDNGAAQLASAQPESPPKPQFDNGAAQLADVQAEADEDTDLADAAEDSVEIVGGPDLNAEEEPSAPSVPTVEDLYDERSALGDEAEPAEPDKE